MALDHDKFEQTCRNIVNQVESKFIDLRDEVNESDDGELKNAKKDHFAAELNKLDIIFKTPNCYDLPQGKDENEVYLGEYNQF